MEWTGQQQILFFLQSVCVGGMQGLLFDAMTGVGRSLRKIQRAVLDALFGPCAAIVAFLGSLVIMDGQPHPLLLTGYVCGLVIEHLAIGSWVSSAVVFVCRLPRQATRWLINICGMVRRQIQRKTSFLLNRWTKTQNMMKK